MKTLGLDISTVTAGYAIVENKIILDCGYFDISKENTYKGKASIIINGLTAKLFDSINIEESLSGFMFGKSSQQTILKLAKNRAVVGYILEEHYKKPINYINATTMRKQLFGKSRVKGIPAKQYVKMNIENMFDVSKWVKYNKKNNPDKKMEDVYDAIVAACYQL